MGGTSPGVTGAATERPLEGVAEDPTGAGYIGIENAHSLSGRDYKGWVGAGARGIPPPLPYKKDRSILLLRSLMLFDTLVMAMPAQGPA